MPQVRHVLPIMLHLQIYCWCPGSYHAHADQNASGAGVQAEQRQLRRKAKPELSTNSKWTEHGALSNGSRLAATCIASYSALTCSLKISHTVDIKLVSSRLWSHHTALAATCLAIQPASQGLLNHQTYFCQPTGQLLWP